MKPARKALSKKVSKPSTRSTRRESSLLPPFGFCVAPCHACHSPCCPVFQWGSGTNKVRVPVTSKLLPPTRTSAHWCQMGLPKRSPRKSLHLSHAKFGLIGLSSPVIKIPSSRIEATNSKFGTDQKFLASFISKVRFQTVAHSAGISAFTSARTIVG